MRLSEIIPQIAHAWPEYRATRTVNSSTLAYRLVVEAFPAALAQGLRNSATLKIEGSTGRGNVTAAPWVSTFDTRITETATSGYYVVYLFSVDMSEVTLCLGFGTTQFQKQFRKQTQEKILTAVETLRSLVDHSLPPGLVADPLDLRCTTGDRLHIQYEWGTIYRYQSYRIAELPRESQLLDDYNGLVAFYRELVEDPRVPATEDFLEAAIEHSNQKLSPRMLGVFEPAEKKSSRGSKGKKGKRRRRYSKESLRVGRAGEEAVLVYEAGKLRDIGREDLAEQIVAHCRKSEYPGWDITSFDANGEPLYIEVKATKSESLPSVQLTRNEWEAAKSLKRRKRYVLYLVTKALTSNPEIRSLRNPAQYVDAKELVCQATAFELSLTRAK